MGESRSLSDVNGSASPRPTEPRSTVHLAVSFGLEAVHRWPRNTPNSSWMASPSRPATPQIVVSGHAAAWTGSRPTKKLPIAPKSGELADWPAKADRFLVENLDREGCMAETNTIGNTCR